MRPRGLRPSSLNLRAWRRRAQNADQPRAETDGDGVIASPRRMRILRPVRERALHQRTPGTVHMASEARSSPGHARPHAARLAHSQAHRRHAPPATAGDSGVTVRRSQTDLSGTGTRVARRWGHYRDTPQLPAAPGPATLVLRATGRHCQAARPDSAHGLTVAAMPRRDPSPPTLPGPQWREFTRAFVRCTVTVMRRERY
jgi:hypothetical protein